MTDVLECPLVPLALFAYGQESHFRNASEAAPARGCLPLQITFPMPAHGFAGSRSSRRRLVSIGSFYAAQHQTPSRMGGRTGEHVNDCSVLHEARSWVGEHMGPECLGTGQ